MKKSLLYLLFFSYCIASFSQVEKVNTSYGANHPHSVSYNGSFYFIQEDGLYKFDESGKSSALVKAIAHAIAVYASYDGIYVSTSGTNLPETELWKSDGTEAGTSLFVSYPASPDYINDFHHTDTLLYFTYNRKVYRSNGNPGGTYEVSSSFGNPVLYTAGNTLFIRDTDDERLYQYDQTSNAASSIRDHVDLAGLAYQAKDHLFFNINDPVEGLSLWKVDEAGNFTKLKNTVPSSPQGSLYTDNDAAMLGNVLYFTINSARELWRTDGTQEGTYLVKKLNEEQSFGYLAASAGRLFYLVFNNTENSFQLYTMNSAETIHTLMGTLPANTTELISSGKYIVFTANTNELWQSDGTAEGTVMVKKFEDTDDSGNFTWNTLTNLAAINQSVYFMREISHIDQTGNTSEETEYWRITPVPPCPPSGALLMGDTVVCKDILRPYSIDSFSDVSYSWNLPAGGTVNGTGSSVNIQWTAAGTHTLSVTLSRGGCDVVKSMQVRVIAKPSAPVVHAPTQACTNHWLSYVVDSLPGISYAWKLTGPASMSKTGRVFSYKYSVTGNYTITVTPSNKCGAGDVSSKSITVVPGSTALDATISGDSVTEAGNTAVYKVPHQNGVTFDWTVEGGDFTEYGDSIKVTWSNKGTYAVTATPSNQCGEGKTATYSVRVKELIIQGTDGALAAGTVDVYPNPCNGLLTVNVHLSQDLDYRLCHSTGQVLQAGTLKPMENRIALEQASKGIYYLHVSGEAGSMVRKIVVE